MKDILYDIELDFYELKFFLENLNGKSNDKKLQEVALRAVENLSKRVDGLRKEIQNISISSSPKETIESSFVNSISVTQDNCSTLVDDILGQRNTNIVEEKITPEDMAGNVVEVLEKIEMEQPPKIPSLDNETPIVALGSLYRVISLNDVFYYTKELYSGNSVAFKEDIRALEEIGEYQKAINYLLEKLKCDAESDVFQSFDLLLQKFFKVR